ncbi:hypothetical protein Q4R94_18355, partial [Morganella morganii]
CRSADRQFFCLRYLIKTTENVIQPGIQHKDRNNRVVILSLIIIIRTDNRAFLRYFSLFLLPYGSIFLSAEL